MSYTSIGGSLTTIISEVSGMANVYNRMPKSLQEYPCAVVLADGHENSFSDLSANKRVYRFRILLFYRTENSIDAESNLRTATDNIIDAIETDVTLSGTCDFAAPTRASWSYVERESPLRTVEIIVEANKRVNRNV